MITLSGVFVIPPKRLLKHFSACSILIKCYLVRVEQAVEIEMYVHQYLLGRMKHIDFWFQLMTLIFWAQTYKRKHRSLVTSKEAVLKAGSE